MKAVSEKSDFSTVNLHKLFLSVREMHKQEVYSIRREFVLGLMTLILFCMSIVLAQDCENKCNVCSLPPCAICPGGHFGSTVNLSTNELIFEVYSPSGVISGPGDTIFAIPTARTITEIGTYHWYGPKGHVGTIGLQNVNNGTIYGPWQASGYSGMNGAQDVLWVVSTHVYLPAGTYKIMDSDQSTWSYTPNDCTGSAGLCWIFAQKENADAALIQPNTEAFNMTNNTTNATV